MINQKIFTRLNIASAALGLMLGLALYTYQLSREKSLTGGELGTVLTMGSDHSNNKTSETDDDAVQLVNLLFTLRDGKGAAEVINKQKPRVGREVAIQVLGDLKKVIDGDIVEHNSGHQTIYDNITSKMKTFIEISENLNDHRTRMRGYVFAADLYYSLESHEKLSTKERERIKSEKEKLVSKATQEYSNAIEGEENVLSRFVTNPAVWASIGSLIILVFTKWIETMAVEFGKKLVSVKPSATASPPTEKK